MSLGILLTVSVTGVVLAMAGRLIIDMNREEGKYKWY